ncbi:MAG: hypothetical protein RLZZ507_2115 [Cyanobacteriota bacterium]|jgi:WD40 repeat protein
MSNFKTRLANMPIDKRRDFLEIPTYLAKSSAGERLQKLLTNFEFLDFKVSESGVESLIADYELALQSQLEFSEETQESLTLIQDALRLSADALAVDTRQLAAQFLGRLPHFDTPEIRKLLTQAKQQPELKLYPLTPSLTAPGGAMLRTLIGHTEEVMAVALAYTDAGIQIVSGSWDKNIKIWDFQTGQEIRTLHGHSDRVWSVAVTPNNKQIVSGSQDNNIKVWDLKKGTELLTLTGHSDCVSSVIVTPDGSKIISASWDKTIKIWNLETGEELLTLTGHTEQINAIAITPDGCKIVSGSDDRTVRVWDLLNGIELIHIKPYKDKINDITISADSKEIILVSGDDIKIFNLQTGQSVDSFGTLALASFDELAIAVTPDGEKIISGSDENTINIWGNWGSHPSLETLIGHSGDINDLVVTADSKYLISASRDNTIKIWNLQKHKPVPILPGHQSTVHAIAVSPDGKKAISAEHFKLKIWDLHKCRELFTFNDVEISWRSALQMFKITPDSQRVIAAAKYNTLKVFDLHSGQELFSLERHDKDVLALAVTPDGKKAVSASEDKTIKVWDLNSGQNLLTINGHDDWVVDVIITPDGKKIISASRDNTIKVWDLQTGTELLIMSGDKEYERIRAISITPDDQNVVSSGDYGIKVWNLGSSQELLTLSGNQAFFNPVPITPDATKIVSRLDSTTLKVWNINNGVKLIQTFTEHTNYINDVAISPNSKYAVSVSEDQSLKVWDLQTGEVVASFNGNTELTSCAISPDGLTILAGEKSGCIHFLRFRENGEISDDSDLVLGAWQKAQQLFSECSELLYYGKYEEAVQIFDEVIEIDPNFYQAWWKKGEALSRLEFYYDAYRTLWKAYQILPSSHDDSSTILLDYFTAQSDLEKQVYNNVLDDVRDGGDIQKGIDKLTMLLKYINDDFAEGYGLRAFLRNKLNDYQGAIEDYKEAIELKSELAKEYNEKLAYAYYNRGVYLHNLEEYDAAIENYTNAINLDPLLDSAYGNRGLIYRGFYNDEAAIADFTKAAEISLNQGNVERYNKLMKLVRDLQD